MSTRTQATSTLKRKRSDADARPQPASVDVDAARRPGASAAGPTAARPPGPSTTSGRRLRERHPPSPKQNHGDPAPAPDLSPTSDTQASTQSVENKNGKDTATQVVGVWS